MHILALDAYHGGSHKAFINNWQLHSAHQWTLLSLPAHHWKWRMSHAAITFNQQLKTQTNAKWDVLLCTDMLNLAEFIGLSDKHIQALPRVIYFHENQLTYPSLNPDQRDLHYAFINFTSALCADEIWFNSNWHKDNFLQSLSQWLMRMPDHKPDYAIQTIYDKAKIHYPGITHSLSLSDKKPDNPCLNILWAARWEHDKNPECFFAALKLLKQNKVDFKLNVIGAAANKIPDIFQQAKIEFSDHIQAWGFASSQQDYQKILHDSDVIVSTANHEFFGMAVIEAVAASCIPLLPNRLAYPETMHAFKQPDYDCFYDGTPQHLFAKLKFLSTKIQDKNWINKVGSLGPEISRPYLWPQRSVVMDSALKNLTGPTTTKLDE